MASMIDKTVTSKYQPKSTNVIWVDTSQNPPIEKHFINGRWVAVSGGGGGTKKYSDLEDKPTINGVELDGNKTSQDLGVYSKPLSGIPESDLSSDVQQALQKHFKGWYDSSSNLPANPVIGDYAYVKGAETTDPAAIYECTTDGSWSDSGRTADTSNVQTFASGEEVNEVKIVQNLSGGQDDVLSAEMGKMLSDKITNVGVIVLDLLKKAVYNDNDAGDYITQLELELTGTLMYIEAVYTQTNDVYVGQSLEELRDDITVTAYYDDGSSAAVTNYSLTGTLASGTSVVNVSCLGKTTTISVTVLPALYYRDGQVYYKGALTATSILSPITHITKDGVTYVYTQKGVTVLDCRACYFYFDLALTGGTTYVYKFYYSGLPEGVSIKMAITGCKQSLWNDGRSNVFHDHSSDLIDSGWLFPILSDGTFQQTLENPALSVGVRILFMAIDGNGDGVEWPDSLTIDRFVINPA